MLHLLLPGLLLTCASVMTAGESTARPAGAHQHERLREFLRDHPEAREKAKAWIKAHPEAREQIAERLRAHLEQHPEIRDRLRERLRERRSGE